MKVRQVLECAVKHETDYGIEYEYVRNPAHARLLVSDYELQHKHRNPDFKFSVVWVRKNVIEHVDPRFLITCIAEDFVAEYATWRDASSNINPVVKSDLVNEDFVVQIESI